MQMEKESKSQFHALLLAHPPLEEKNSLTVCVLAQPGGGR